MADARINMIRSARLRLGESPRKFKKGLRSYLKVKRPLSLGRNRAKRNQFYQDFDILLKEGRVVWGVLVIANNALFAKGTNDAPGVVVYSPHFHLHDDLLRLSDAAEKVSKLREGPIPHSSDEEQEFAKMIRDDYAWFTSHPVPKSIAGEDSLLASSVMFFRKHLPNQLLSLSTFPIVVHPEVETAILLPEYFWPAELRSYWENPS